MRARETRAAIAIAHRPRILHERHTPRRQCGLLAVEETARTAAVSERNVVLLASALLSPGLGVPAAWMSV